MAAFRLFLMFAVLVVSFTVGAPLQWLVARRAPRFAHRIPILFCRSLLWILRVRVRVVGERAFGRAEGSVAHPVLLAANHVSWIDILALGGLMPFCFLAKSEVAAWPIVSAFADVQGTVFVDRRRRRSLPLTNRQMASRMLEGRPVLLFPEGTTVGKPGPARFHSSLFASARDAIAMSVPRETGLRDTVSVQPVAVDYSTDAAAWVGDDNLLSHLWRTLRNPPLHCSLSFGVPIPYSASSDRKRVAIETREAIIDMLRLRSAEAGIFHTYDAPDVTAADLAAELGRRKTAV